MTKLDPMPFGKYRGTPLGRLPVAYQAWLKNQDWLEDSHPEIYEILCGRSAATFKDTEIDAHEERVMATAPEGFPEWWWKQYGKNLRQQKSPQHTAFLNVALTAWKAALNPEEIPY